MQIPDLYTSVFVKWQDSTTQHNWQYVLPGEPPDVGLRPCMQTVGFLIYVGDEFITLAHTIAPRGSKEPKEGYLGILSIPKGAINSIQEIK